MPRLTKEDWKHIRGRFEVNGESQNSLAKEFGVHVSAVNTRAKKEGWATKGKHRSLAERKVETIKALIEIDDEKSKLPVETQKAVDVLARRELELQGISAEFRRALFSRGRALLDAVCDPNDLLTLARVHSEITRTPTAPSTVNQIAIGDVGKGARDAGPVVTHNIMPVPVADSVDAWEQVAQTQQKKLTKRS